MFFKRPSYSAFRRRLAAYEARLTALEHELASKPWKRNILIPSPDVYVRGAAEPFMQYSTCSALDFFHPRFSELSALLRIPVSFHRKYWEWVYILNVALARGLSATSAKVLGFGVGATEPLPAVFAKLGASVTATDAPRSIAMREGWLDGGTHASGVDSLQHDGIVDRETLRERVRYEECDMNEIAPHLRDYDFVWSSCCFEHLGNIEKGLAFVVESVETLAPGGVACHTTELNLSSDAVTVERGPTVLFRKRDLESLIADLRRRGHVVNDLIVAPDTHHLDGYVDTPPYSEPPHLKLDLDGYASTSVAVVVQRGSSRLR